MLPLAPVALALGLFILSDSEPAGGPLSWWWALALLLLPATLATIADRLGRAGKFRSVRLFERALGVSGTLAFAFLLFATDWRPVVEAWLGVFGELTPWPTAATFVLLVPSVLFELAVIRARARLIDPSPLGFARACRAQTRGYLTCVAPLALIGALSWLLGSIPAIAVRLEEVRLFDVLVLALFGWLVTSSMPRVLAFIWDTAPFPSQMASMFQALLNRAGVRIANQHLWQAGNGSENALIVGVTGGTRRVFVTEALTHRLAPLELEAVLAHEVGHARRGHANTFLCFVATNYILLELATGPLETLPVWAQYVLSFGSLLLLVIALARLSRYFELEADLESRDLMGSADALISALIRVTPQHSFARNSWRHFSSQRRTEFLLGVDADPSLGKRLSGRLNRVRIAARVSCLAAVLVLLVHHVGSWNDDHFYADVRLGEVERALARPIQDPDAILLANVLRTQQASSLSPASLAKAVEAAGLNVWPELAARISRSTESPPTR